VVAIEKQNETKKSDKQNKLSNLKIKLRNQNQNFHFKNDEDKQKRISGW
jgi:hypothetical protein